MKNKTACFTGHREIPEDQYNTIDACLTKPIRRLIENNYCFFCTGGALGFDTMAAQTVLNLKQSYPHIRLILVLPYPEQAHKWDIQNKIVYEQIKLHADRVIYTAQTYYRGCMHIRNRFLVDNSSICICYQTEDHGGTAYTVHYAKKHGLPIINIAQNMGNRQLT